MRNLPQWWMHSSLRTQFPEDVTMYSVPQRQQILQEPSRRKRSVWKYRFWALGPFLYIYLKHYFINEPFSFGKCRCFFFIKNSIKEIFQQQQWNSGFMLLGWTEEAVLYRMKLQFCQTQSKWLVTSTLPDLQTAFSYTFSKMPDIKPEILIRNLFGISISTLGQLPFQRYNVFYFQ